MGVLEIQNPTSKTKKQNNQYIKYGACRINTAEIKLSNWAVEAVDYPIQKVRELLSMREKKLKDMEEDLEIKHLSVGFGRREQKE